MSSHYKAVLESKLKMVDLKLSEIKSFSQQERLRQEKQETELQILDENIRIKERELQELQALRHQKILEIEKGNNGTFFESVEPKIPDSSKEDENKFFLENELKIPEPKNENSVNNSESTPKELAPFPNPMQQNAKVFENANCFLKYISDEKIAPNRMASGISELSSDNATHILKKC